MRQNDDTTPEQAVELYLKERKPEVAKSTYQNHTYHLTRFIEWCEETGFDCISDLDGLTIHEYKVWRREAGDVNEVTLKNQLCTFRVFVRWCESMELVKPGLADKILLPELDPGEDQRDTAITAEAANEILDYLDKMEYGTLRHAFFYLLWHTGMRLGSARAIDLEDYYPEENYIELSHRPETGTPLKNKQKGERQINLESGLCEVLDDYIQFNRPDVTDEHRRKPLFATKSGRAYRTLLRQHINAVTRPCHYTGDCPHSRTPQKCEATGFDSAQKCPSSVSPHPIRRSAITHHLNQDVPKEIASDRMNVSTDVLDKHYDARTEGEKRKLRKEYLGNI